MQVRKKDTWGSYPQEDKFADFLYATLSTAGVSLASILVTPQSEAGFVIGPLDTLEDESWFWTDEWQRGERRADKDLAEGRYTDFRTVDELIEHLHATRQKRGKRESR